MPTNNEMKGQASGRVKDFVEDVKDKVHDALDSLHDKTHRD